MSDTRPCRCGKTAACKQCHLAAYSPLHRRKWGIDGPADPPPVPRYDCTFLGVVVEACTTCKTPEPRHVRQCFHDDNPTETCTAGVVSDRIWTCARCPNYLPTVVVSG